MKFRFLYFYLLQRHPSNIIVESPILSVETMLLPPATPLLLFLLTTITFILLLRSPSLLPPHTPWTPSSKWRSKSKVYMLLGVETDNEGRDVDDLLSDAVDIPH